MIWVKKVFGIVLVGVGLFYIGLAFFAKLTPWILAATLLLGGIYLGFLERSGRDRKGFQAVKMLVGVVSIIFGVLMVHNLTRPSVEWTPYSAEAYEMALSEGSPIVLDFYADWCIPCLELDQVTFVDEGVIEALNKFKRFKVDLTNFDSEESEILRQQFDIIGVPTIVFIGSNGQEVKTARIVGFLNPEDFLEQVDMVD
jgi:thioredoxin:protein disulfide reductase